MNQNKLKFDSYNKQFDNLYHSKDVKACFDLFKNTPHLELPFDYYMLETLNLNFENYTEPAKETLLNCYVSSLESYNLTIHNQMIIASLVEDLLSNEKIKNKVWNKILSANLKDKELIQNIFEVLDVRENPELCFELFKKYPDFSILSQLWSHYTNYYSENWIRLIRYN